MKFIWLRNSYLYTNEENDDNIKSLKFSCGDFNKGLMFPSNVSHWHIYEYYLLLKPSIVKFQKIIYISSTF